MEVGRSLAPCTTELDFGYIEKTEGFPLLKDYRIVLIDTPGFNDTPKADSTILKKVATWLENSYVVPEVYKARKSN